MTCHCGNPSPPPLSELPSLLPPPTTAALDATPMFAATSCASGNAKRLGRLTSAGQKITPSKGQPCCNICNNCPTFLSWEQLKIKILWCRAVVTSTYHCKQLSMDLIVWAPSKRNVKKEDEEEAVAAEAAEEEEEEEETWTSSSENTFLATGPLTMFAVTVCPRPGHLHSSKALISKEDNNTVELKRPSPNCAGSLTRK
jgi:hypothetical protein